MTEIFFSLLKTVFLKVFIVKMIKRLYCFIFLINIYTFLSTIIIHLKTTDFFFDSIASSEIQKMNTEDFLQYLSIFLFCAFFYFFTGWKKLMCVFFFFKSPWFLMCLILKYQATFFVPQVQNYENRQVNHFGVKMNSI